MSDYRKFDAALQSAGVCYKTDEPMSAHTSFKIGGPADRFVEVKTVSELQAVLNAVSDENVPYFILGNGSNLLVPDEGLRGAVLTLQGDFKKVTALICAVDLCPATWIPCKYRFNQIPPSNAHFGTSCYLLKRPACRARFDTSCAHRPVKIPVTMPETSRTGR